MINKAFKSVLELIKAFPNEQACIDHLEQLQWNGKVISPYDPDSKVWKCAGNQYICKNTNKRFNVRTGTMFDNSKIPLQTWFLSIFLMVEHKKGISSHQMARDLNITQKASWFMQQRIRACFGLEELKPEMTDNTQLDETFVGGKNKNRHADKKVPFSTGRAYKDKTPVMGMLSSGKVRAQVIPSTQAKDIQPLVLRYIPKNTTIITDEWKAYNGLSEHYQHEIVNHGHKEYLNDCGFTTNSIEGFWAGMKRGIIGVYHYTSRKHLQKYVDEFAFRYNNREGGSFDRFNLLLANSGHRLKYKELTA